MWMIGFRYYTNNENPAGPYWKHKDHEFINTELGKRVFENKNKNLDELNRWRLNHGQEPAKHLQA